VLPDVALVSTKAEQGEHEKHVNARMFRRDPAGRGSLKQVGASLYIPIYRLHSVAEREFAKGVGCEK
jgi:hypothetical protein